eukprot:TRINITY_DN10643_c0_g1_i9.p1 TRINITY_DN10643_c0_g1~~TRINITY_DN10643_c0_g1_i9.p1  ORF type:complete len:159 (-),score=48.49 TRINITY_DN10643_c0_g1_i9:811-1287(-)
MENVMPVMETPTLSDSRFSEKGFKSNNDDLESLLSRSSIHNDLKVKPTKTVLLAAAPKKTAPPTNFDALYATIKKPTVEMFSPEGDFLASCRKGFLKTFTHDVYSKELEAELSKGSQNPQELLLTLSNMLIQFAYSLTDPIKYVLCFYKVIKAARLRE